MLRSNPAASMQKTYDEAYLTCSTAIYFEKQNNEEQALRSWREALDQIYYHNAYKVPANYRPKTETEKALQESLHQMELQCKERVDLLDALKKSRSEARAKLRKNDPPTPNGSSPAPSSSRAPPPPPLPRRSNVNLARPPPYSPSPSINDNLLGDGTVPPSEFSDIARPTRPLSAQSGRMPSHSLAPVSSAPPQPSSSASQNAPAPPVALKPPAAKKTSRSPSPDKKSSMLKSTLRSEKKGQNKSSAALPATMRPSSKAPKSAAKAATLAWPAAAAQQQQQQALNSSAPTNLSSSSLASQINNNVSRNSSLDLNNNSSSDLERRNVAPTVQPPSPSDYLPPVRHQQPYKDPTSRQKTSESNTGWPLSSDSYFPSGRAPATTQTLTAPSIPPPAPPPHGPRRRPGTESANPYQDAESNIIPPPPPPDFPAYRKEYPTPAPIDPKKVQGLARNPPSLDPTANDRDTKTRSARPPVPRKAIPNSSSNAARADSSRSNSSVDMDQVKRSNRINNRALEEPISAELPSEDVDSAKNTALAWDARVDHIMKNLPRGVDEQAAKAIFNEVVIKGDEVHWDDIAGLEIAKGALKEAVVYPFLRPDLFMGLREPARGMLLFGPPGTGKTMLARAVATESRSTFFAISASSLTSKFLGESEKLVRALFALAKALTPSIIFVDEIDSLLSARAGSGEHEATRRIKTEFLIQWSDLAKAAAGREPSDKDGDPSRVLVLAATNLPWAIDEAARRRFVRRQYIPLPEDEVRGEQLRRLISAQKHGLGDADIAELVALTDGFSGSDITALAKDAAMGPLRSLGEQLLQMSPDEIRPIMFQDFEASLINIRPSVSRQGLKEYEDWAKEFGERGG